jgi:hypothetical protein
VFSVGGRTVVEEVHADADVTGDADKQVVAAVHR